MITRDELETRNDEVKAGILRILGKRENGFYTNYSCPHCRMECLEDKEEYLHCPNKLCNWNETRDEDKAPSLWDQFAEQVRLYGPLKRFPGSITQ